MPLVADIFRKVLLESAVSAVRLPTLACSPGHLALLPLAPERLPSSRSLFAIGTNEERTR